LQLFNNPVPHFFSRSALSIWIGNVRAVFRTIRFDDFQSVFRSIAFRVITRTTILLVFGFFHDKIRSFYVAVTTSCFISPVFPLQNYLQWTNRVITVQTELLSKGTSLIPCTSWHHIIPQTSRNKSCRSRLQDFCHESGRAGLQIPQ